MTQPTTALAVADVAAALARDRRQLACDLVAWYDRTRPLESNDRRLVDVAQLVGELRKLI